MKNRLRFLTVLDVIKDNSSPEIHLNANQIVDILANRGIKVDVKTILSDINNLIEYGYKIRKVYDGVFYDGQLFSLAELRILNDGIRASSFLTKKKADEIVNKLLSLTNKYDQRIVCDSTYDNNISNNPSVIYNIENILNAINNHQAISFRYFDYDPSFKKIYRKHNYLVYPYSLMVDNNRYYLIGSSLKYGGYSNYRIDKMEDVVSKKKYYTDTPNDLQSYIDKLFKMYNSEVKNITLKIKNHLLDEVYQQFNKQMIVMQIDDDYFICNINVSVSKNFFGWLFMLNDEVEILKPNDVKEDYLKMCKAIINQYL